MQQYFLIPFIIAAFAAFVNCSPIQGIARDVKSDLVLLNRMHAQTNFNNGNNEPRKSRHEMDLPLGEALDLFYRYGFFSLSVRVVPRDDPGAWLIREPTATVFQPNSISTRISSTKSRFEPDFQIFTCDDEAELFEAFFRDFTAEGIEQPHKLYTGSWHASTKSKYLGLPKNAFDGESSFVLVKLNKRRTAVSVVSSPGQMRLQANAASAAAAVRIGDRQSVLDFIGDFGSHFIRDLVIGDSIYQVFALNRDQYLQAKRSLSQQPHPMSRGAFKQFYQTHLAPWLVRETGSVLSASGDRALSEFLELNVRDVGQMGGSHPNIFRLDEDSRLMSQLEALTASTSAVIGMHFASLREWIPSIHTREFYDEIVSSQATLWGVNI